MTDEVVRYRLIVRGRVQGVFFRDSCRQEAALFGVAGSVRNLPDGSVEVIAEGLPQSVESLAGWCRQGPERAEVTDVELIRESPRGVTDFVVLD